DFLTHATRITPFRNRGQDERELTFFELLTHFQTGTPFVSRAHVRSQLLFIIARSFMMPFVPILTTALALTRKRQRNLFALPLAFIIMLASDHLLQLGHSIIATGHTSSIIIWIPTFLFALISLAFFLQRADILLLFRAWKQQRQQQKQ
ncbi:MAG: transporter, partial [Acetobacter sp.]|nr:transporter [Acetobacter sp.]